MNEFLKLLTSNIAICCYESAAVGFLIVSLVRLQRKKKSCITMCTLQKEKARDERLDQVLSNELYDGDINSIRKNNIPYEINFHEEVTKGTGVVGDVIVLQLVEQSKLSTRKYVVNISDEIYVGRAQENELVLNDYMISAKQCRIFKYGQNLFLETVDLTHPIAIHRRKNAMTLESEAVMLQDGDSIELGETRLDIRII